MLRVAASLILLLGIALDAQASSPCMFLSVPCNSEPTAGSITSGAAFPSFADMFNLNPASIPTIETPVGVEGIVSTDDATSSRQSNFSLLKGFESLGIAASSNSDNTFYTYNLIQAMRGVTNPQAIVGQNTAENSVMPSLNLGSALALAFDSIKESFVPQLGVNARYNKFAKRFEWGGGISLNGKNVTFGVGTILNQGNAAAGYPTTSTTTWSLGFRFWSMHFDYSLLHYRTNEPGLRDLTLFNRPMAIYTLSADIGIFHPTMAYRSAYNLAGDRSSLTLFSLLVVLTDRLALSLMSNYVPGTRSIGMQLFF